MIKTIEKMSEFFAIDQKLSDFYQKLFKNQALNCQKLSKNAQKLVFKLPKTVKNAEKSLQIAKYCQKLVKN